MEQQSKVDSPLPLVLTSLVTLLHKLKAHQTEGIFRIPGSAKDITRMKVMIEAGQYKFEDTVDPHVPASVLKLWLRSLDDPIIPFVF